MGHKLSTSKLRLLSLSRTRTRSTDLSWKEEAIQRSNLWRGEGSVIKPMAKWSTVSWTVSRICSRNGVAIWSSLFSLSHSLFSHTLCHFLVTVQFLFAMVHSCAMRLITHWCLLTQNQNSLLCFAVDKSLTKGDGRCTIRAGKWLQQVSSLKQSNSSRQKKKILYGKETFLLLIISRDFCNSSYSWGSKCVVCA